jgi:hypothetical protein
MAGLLFAAVVLAAAEALTLAAASLLAPSQDVATGEWISAAVLGEALLDFGSVLFWVTAHKRPPGRVGAACADAGAAPPCRATAAVHLGSRQRSCHRRPIARVIDG